MYKTLNLLLLMALTVVIAGCSSDNENSAAAEGPVILDDTGQCPIPEQDFAEQLFTEADRQWFCSVTAEAISMTDEVFFSRNGQAETARFRAVFWNRSLADQSLTVASPFISPFVISNISSSNTVLTFDLINESGGVEAYDCVLVGREISPPGLI